MVSNPFQISIEDVERSSTLKKRDVGKWAYVSNGCINVVDTKIQADEIVKFIRHECCQRQSNSFGDKS